MTYHSEHGQDKWLNENVFKGKQLGVFVEFGAIDGVLTSNTLFFEKELAWNGLCIEPIHEEFNKLQRNRDCHCENYAISVGPGSADFLIYKGCIGWSGLKRHIEPQHEERIKDHGGETEIREVPTIRLDTLLKKYNLYRIDYMSVDTEGNEEKIMRSLDLNCFDIGIVDIENNYGNYDIENFMKGYRYEKIARLGVNDIFRKKGFQF